MDFIGILKIGKTCWSTFLIIGCVEYTGIVTDNPDVVKLDPEKRLLTTMEMIRDKHLTKYDLAMMSWARLDSQVHKSC